MCFQFGGNSSNDACLADNLAVIIALPSVDVRLVSQIHDGGLRGGKGSWKFAPSTGGG